MSVRVVMLVRSGLPADALSTFSATSVALQSELDEVTLTRETVFE